MISKKYDTEDRNESNDAGNSALITGILHLNRKQLCSNFYNFHNIILFPNQLFLLFKLKMLLS